MKYLKFAIVISVLILSCQRESQPLSPVLQEKKVKTFLPLQIVPDSGRAGDVLCISGMEFKPDYFWNIKINNAQWIQPDSCDLTKIFIHVPFEGVSDSLILWTFKHPDTMGLVENFQFIRECDSSDITVVPYNLNVPLSYSQAIQTVSGLQKEWSVDIKQDTVILERYFTTILESMTQKCILKYSDNLDLPEVIDIFTVEHTDFGRHDTLKMDAGIVKIAEWDTTSSISGRIIGRSNAEPYGNYWGLDYTFWYNFPR